VKIIVHGPAAGPGPDGMVSSWAPDQPVDVDDGDKKAVTWAQGFVKSGLATLVEDAAPRSAKAPSRQPAA
jgi:hypothetical protein